ncbi:fatty acyl-AMP ligase [Streptomyces sp. NPDC050982]|uniref:fatty acyl-AMP ligase n=1 Tax=Streptomyces sp. NPDC050982 TaxID=3154746 RepID=UPI0033FB8886
MTTASITPRTPVRGTPRTFTDVVRERTDALAGRDAFVFLPDDGQGSVPEHLTYAGLDRRARGIASWLREHGAVGRPVLLLHPPGTAFVAAFVGCLYAGSVAVPAPLPTDQGQQLARVAGILRDSGASAVLSTGMYVPLLEAWLASVALPRVRCLATDREEVGDPSSWRAPDTSPDDLAFLQYTSGSTSEPKGVMVTHANLLANEAAIGRWAGTHEGMVVGGWLPHYHDLGLIGHLLHSLYVGGLSVQMSPLSFLKRPRRWLEMIGDYRVEGSGAPDFAYDLCLRRVTDEQLARLDLSSWRCAPNGAEPVRADTLRAFVERFSPAGLRREVFAPCYGLAETTLLVTGADPATEPTIRTVDAAALEQGVLAVGEGRTLAGSGSARDCEVRIVAPGTGAPLADGLVGEIWVRGPSVTAGYFGNEAATADCFGADGWLRTGDLGVLDEGELFVTGRLKEVIVLAGRNLYPHDIERAAQSAAPSLTRGAGAAFAVRSGRGAGAARGATAAGEAAASTGATDVVASACSEREHLVLIQEVRLAAVRDGDLRAVATAAQHAIGRQFAVPAGNVVLVKPGTVRRTTSGKVRRTTMRDLFLDGSLTPLYEVLEPVVRDLVGDAPDTAALDASDTAAPSNGAPDAAVSS